LPFADRAAPRRLVRQARRFGAETKARGPLACNARPLTGRRTRRKGETSSVGRGERSSRTHELGAVECASAHGNALPFAGRARTGASAGARSHGGVPSLRRSRVCDERRTRGFQEGTRCSGNAPSLERSRPARFEPLHGGDEGLAPRCSALAREKEFGTRQSASPPPGRPAAAKRARYPCKSSPTRVEREGGRRRRSTAHVTVLTRRSCCRSR